MENLGIINPYYTPYKLGCKNLNLEILNPILY
nr:MAG TPA: hypothetical protein [Caudoviricetes sp.]